MGVSRTSLRRLPRFLPVLLAFCLLPPARLQAQALLTEVSPKEMTKLLGSMGFEVKEQKALESDQHALKFELSGYTVVMFLANGNTDAQLYVGFSDEQVTPQQMNEWNKAHRFSRAYVDGDGNPILETDIDFTGGVSEDNIKAWVRLFRDLLTSYVDYLN
jgi:hypothetical protein